MTPWPRPRPLAACLQLLLRPCKLSCTLSSLSWLFSFHCLYSSLSTVFSCPFLSFTLSLLFLSSFVFFLLSFCLLLACLANWKCGVSLINSVAHLLIFIIRTVVRKTFRLWTTAAVSGRGLPTHNLACILLCSWHLLNPFSRASLLFSFFFLYEKLFDLLFLICSSLSSSLSSFLSVSLPLYFACVYLCPHCRLPFLLWHCGDCSVSTSLCALAAALPSAPAAFNFAAAQFSVCVWL